MPEMHEYCRKSANVCGSIAISVIFIMLQLANSKLFAHPNLKLL